MAVRVNLLNCPYSPIFYTTDREVRHWIRKMYTALKKFRLNKTPDRKRKLRTLSQIVKELVRTKHQRYLRKSKLPLMITLSTSGVIIKHFWVGDLAPIRRSHTTTR